MHRGAKHTHGSSWQFLNIRLTSSDSRQGWLPARSLHPPSLHTSGGIEVIDCLRIFTGDKPAQSFERGTQQRGGGGGGGNYKCGSCGVKSAMIQDQAHSLRQTWRSLEDLQKLVLGGCHGNQAGCSKPLSKLRVKIYDRSSEQEECLM